ncbi:Uncharacterised protein [Afipia felis]|uniref:Uncharacterized protein n=2 Tax=Afipia felis TaxID=1035 RepID=A0A380W7S3_AFIFE|nr:hypothetical protein HMPREF9697_00762 [Afipia felis ATCC 53690]SUU76944.1 Uncharacterised protein [Afipia felis]SUU85010.1 Uncharacterised protein [Afipia felis]
MSNSSRKRPPFIQISPLPRQIQRLPRVRPLELDREEHDALADFLLSFAGTIAGAKETLRVGGPDNARAKLSPVIAALARHMVSLGIGEID